MFGTKYFYLSRDQSNEWFVCPKYSTLKDEVLCFMNMSLFNCSYSKSSKLLKHSIGIRSINNGNNALSEENILSIVLYTDYKALSHRLRSTFFKQCKDESIDAQKLRHSVFVNWSKALLETVKCYGTKWRFNKIEALYHNTSFIHYSLFMTKWNAPTSMTQYFNIAVLCCFDDGLILKMSQCSKQRPKYFDCSLITFYGYEHEMLFVESNESMQIVSIRRLLCKNEENLTYFIKAMRLFNKVLNARILSKTERFEMTQSDFAIIQRLMQPNNDCSDYMNASFVQFCSEQTVIRMDVFCLRDKRYYNEYGNVFVHNRHSNLLRFDRICNLFSNVLCIESWDTGHIKTMFLAALKNILIKINKMKKKTKLKKIIIHCDPLHDSFNFNKKRFKSINWNIRKIESWQFVLFRK